MVEMPAKFLNNSPSSRIVLPLISSPDKVDILYGTSRIVVSLEVAVTISSIYSISASASSDSCAAKPKLVLDASNSSKYFVKFFITPSLLYA